VNRKSRQRRETTTFRNRLWFLRRLRPSPLPCVVGGAGASGTPTRSVRRSWPSAWARTFERRSRAGGRHRVATWATASSVTERTMVTSWCLGRSMCSTFMQGGKLAWRLLRQADDRVTPQDLLKDIDNPLYFACEFPAAKSAHPGGSTARRDVPGRVRQAGRGHSERDQCI
jgi:hypothetical protein